MFEKDSGCVPILKDKKKKVAGRAKGMTSSLKKYMEHLGDFSEMQKVTC